MNTHCERSVPTVVLSLLLLTGLFAPATAQKYLTGELSGKYPAGEYIVSGNIHVLPKTVLSFDQGSTLRFENYTGIVVRGQLICRGSAAQPILFTSSRDIPSSRTMPEAFDWNGIKVTAEAEGITLENCTLKYSTFGLNIESNATPVSIKETKFTSNGSASLTREKRMMPVTDNMSVSFMWPEIQHTTQSSDSVNKDSSAIAGTVKKSANKTKRRKEYAKPKGAWIAPVRISMGSAAALGGIVWLAGSSQSGKYLKQRDNDYPPFSDDWQRADASYRNWGTIQNIGAGLFCLGAIGFSVTFVF